MKKNVGFIGSGKMAQAMIGGMLESRTVTKDQILASALTSRTIHWMEKRYGIEMFKDNTRVASESDYLFFAVKPYVYPEVIEEVKGHLKEDTIIITIAPGVSIKDMTDVFGKQAKVVRSMPNTPSLVGEGMTVICPNENVSDEEQGEVMEIFQAFSQVEVMEEKLMDAVPAISGSSPAYVYVMIEAMADGAVKQGVPRNLAYRLASQAVLGAAKMVRDTDFHPGELKDQVCTPSGTTIKAIAALEENGFRNSIIKAMDATRGE